jgi:hypothetical protein
LWWRIHGAHAPEKLVPLKMQVVGPDGTVPCDLHMVQNILDCSSATTSRKFTRGCYIMIGYLDLDIKRKVYRYITINNLVNSVEVITLCPWHSAYSLKGLTFF